MKSKFSDCQTPCRLVRVPCTLGPKKKVTFCVHSGWTDVRFSQSILYMTGFRKLATVHAIKQVKKDGETLCGTSLSVSSLDWNRPVFPSFFAGHLNLLETAKNRFLHLHNRSYIVLAISKRVPANQSFSCPGFLLTELYCSPILPFPYTLNKLH